MFRNVSGRKEGRNVVGQDTLPQQWNNTGEQENKNEHYIQQKTKEVSVPEDITVKEMHSRPPRQGASFFTISFKFTIIECVGLTMRK